MHIKCRYFSRKNLATGGVEPPPQMPLTVNNQSGDRGATGQKMIGIYIQRSQ